MRIFVKYGVVVIALLLAALVVYLRPTWWESYRYENDRVQVHLHDADGRTLDSMLAGTLVIRLTGPGRPQCGMYPVSPKTVGPANDALLIFDSVSSSITDDAGYASVAMHRGLGRGKRMIIGGCRQNRGFILMLARPGFETRVVVPDVARINSSYQVIKRPQPRGQINTPLENARNRLYAAIRLLYPTRIYSRLDAPLPEDERQILISTAQYWRHELPDGRKLRSYAIENLNTVIGDLDCPRLQDGLADVFGDASVVPGTEEAILTEHNALMPLLYSWADSALTDCEASDGFRAEKIPPPRMPAPQSL